MKPDFMFMYMMIIHYLADFCLQTVYQAQNKGVGKSFWNVALFNHVGMYSIVWFLSVVAISSITGWGLSTCLLFTLITFVCHYLTDWFTSRIGKQFWTSGDYHNGFVVVGIDQVLHYIQLLSAYYLFIIKN